MATNKKITQLDELTPATWADDDVIAIVDISAQETKKIQLSTFRGAVTGVSSLNASTPLTVDSATGDVTISVAINGGGTINAVFDEDDMTSNSPTALATQQSIKAYVDSQVGTVDTLAEILSNGNTSGGTNIVVSSGDVITTNTVNETTAASGVTIDGVLVKDGQVDGRDVSVDGTKLDTVETNADVTDTANVTAAGALMDSELTNITAVKALNQGVATTDTPTFAGLITAGNVDGRDVSADGAKLDGIEAGADVTDTANVTAAGALMDSELTDIAAVKALNQGVATTDSPSFAGLTATTADINGGTIDGTVIGGSSAAAGTFTTFTSTGIDDNATSTAVTIDSSQNVGIGNATPTEKLQITAGASSAILLGYSSSSGSNGYIIRSNSSEAGLDFGFNLEYNDGTALYTVTHNLGSGFHVWYMGGTERMRINSSGNVGIGTSSPNANYAQTIVGNLAIGSGSAAALGGENFIVTDGTTTGKITLGGGPTVQFGSKSNHPVTFFVANGEKVRIDTGGNVAVGRTSSVNGAKVTVETGASTPAVLGYGDRTWLNAYDPNSGGTPVDLRLWAYGNSNATNDAYVGTWSAHPLKFATGGSIRATIDTSGNVGIGINNPSYLTHLYSTSAEPKLVIEDASSGAGRGGVVTGTWGGNGIRLDSLNAAGWVYVGGSNTSYIPFTIGTEKARFHSNGNFGIATTSPDFLLDVAGRIGILEGTNGIAFHDGAGSVSAGVRADSGDNLVFATGSSDTERMRINSAGNVGIGTTGPSSLLHLASTGNAVLTLEADTDNVSESDNARIELSQDGGATTGHMGYGSGTNGIDIWNDYSDYVRIGTNNVERLRVVNNGVVRPATDNAQTLGAAANRWSVVYAGTGTINTSDEREKQQIADLDDAERRVAVAIKGLVKKYKYNDAVALKGDDARIHVGVIAQEVIAAFAAEGLDATHYALLCHDTWEAEPEEVDKNGNVINPGIEAGERYGIRYDELLAFMIAAL
jgi:hypothetical protein